MGVPLHSNRRRWTAIALATGLVLAACTSAEEPPTSTLPATLPSLDPTTTTKQVPEPAETTTPVEATRWNAGACVDLGANADEELPYAPYGAELLIDCGAPHTHEVYFMATLPEGQAAPYPENLNQRLFDECFVVFAELMGFPSVESTLDLVLYLPDEEEWTAGERYHGCVLYQAGTQLVYRPIIGLASDDPDDYRWEVAAGTCYTELDLTLLPLSDAVPCEDLHTLEMIGDAELTPPGGVYPGVEAAAELGGEACTALLAEYAAQDIEDLPLVTFPLPTLVTEGEWDAGARSVKCFVFAGGVEQGLLIATGSLGDGTFEIVDADEGLPA